MKKILWLAAAIILMGNLAGCKKNDNSDVGVWEATAYTHLGIERDIDEIFSNGASLSLKDDGKCTVNINGDSAKGEWDITGGILRISAEGVDFVGVFDKRTLVLEMQSLGINVHFKKKGGTPIDIPEPSEDVPTTTPSYVQRLDSGPNEWWNGEWYGSVSIVEMSDDTGVTIEEFKWDCFANVYDLVDDTSLMELYEFGVAIGNLVIRIDTENGLTDMGKAVVVSGSLMTTMLEAGELEIDPGMSPYENTITWKWREHYEDGEYADYQILLRPWGMTWDDIPENDRTAGYDWYLEIFDAPLSDVGIHIHDD